MLAHTAGHQSVPVGSILVVWLVFIIVFIIVFIFIIFIVISCDSRDVVQLRFQLLNVVVSFIQFSHYLGFILAVACHLFPLCWIIEKFSAFVLGVLGCVHFLEPFGVVILADAPKKIDGLVSFGFGF